MGDMTEAVAKNLDATELIQKLHDFFQQQYYAELVEQARKGCKWLQVDFTDLSKFDPDIADALLEQPEEVLKAAEIAIEQFDVAGDPGAVKGFVARFVDLPESSRVMIRNIRSLHLNKFQLIEGVVRQKSDVRPQVTEAKFECPSCGNTISMLQLDNKFKEPSRCSCGRKGKFRLLAKTLVDAQSLVLEEVPEQLDGGEQPKRLKIFLKNDLVSPLSEKKTNPGSRIILAGILKEVPIITRSGAQSTVFDLLLEANSTMGVQEEFTDINITPEDEQQIKGMSEDPALIRKMVGSVAPSIYGHDQVKEALLLQMLGGVRKKHDDGVVRRGDIHILLVGDPGAAKCLPGETMVVLSDGSQKPIRDIVEPLLNGEERKDISSLHISVPSFDSKAKIKNSKVLAVSKRKTNELLSITTGQGSKIRATPNHPFFVIEKGLIVAKSAEELKKNDFVAVSRYIDCKAFQQPLPQQVQRVSARNANHITLPPYCNEEFARFLGYLVGDGYCAHTKTSGVVTLTGNDDELLDDFTSIAKRLFSVNATRRTAHTGKSAKETHISSRELVSYLEGVSPEITRGARRKTVPDCILKSPLNVVAAFLRALFDCDGTVRAGRRELSLTSANRQLIEQVRLLLKRFAISSQIRIKYQAATNSKDKKKDFYYLLAISGENVVPFSEYVGFSLKRKQDKIQLRVPHANTNISVIPNLSNVLKDLRTKLDMSQFSMNVPRSTYQHYERGDRNPSYGAMQRIVSAFEEFILKKYQTPPLIQEVSEELLVKYFSLKLLAESHVGWEKVSRIEKHVVDEYVYDLQVEDTHNFIANGFVVHNSQLLKRMTVVAPKARFVAGRGASGAGLTATVVKDEFLQGWSLEAGAIVLANRGQLMIDEMDKMSKEDSWSLHEALEQQQVSISKANIQATLRCETTVLAAANPKFGRFDPYDTVANQIDLPPTLINRFDLIFPIKDVPDQKKDEKLATFMLELHKNNIETPPLSTELLRKYVAYARQKIFPKLTDGAIEELKEYFIKMRASAGTGPSARVVPISARQLEGLVRLSEASARMHLRDKVTKKDAKKAIELLDYCLRQVALDEETGQIDIDRIATSMPASQRNKIMTIKEIIAELENKVGKVIPIEDVLKEASAKGLTEAEIEDIIQKLKKSGDIFEPRHGFVSRI